MVVDGENKPVGLGGVLIERLRVSNVSLPSSTRPVVEEVGVESHMKDVNI